MKEIKNGLANSMSYQEYKELVKNLLDQNKSTTKDGPESLVGYSKLNNSRMKRLDKTTEVPESVARKIRAVETKTTWLVLTEGWCGDAAQNLPALNKMAELNKNIELRLVLRDENQDLMNQFLTNGGQSIPKLIQLQNEEVTATWGPRPSEATQLVKKYKEQHGTLDAEFKKDLQVWYNKNKNESLFNDFLTFLT